MAQNITIMGESTPAPGAAIVCIISVRAFLAVYVSASILLKTAVATQLPRTPP